MRATAFRLCEIDAICDYVPIVSTISNAVKLFEKYVFLPPQEKIETKDIAYWTHVSKKSVFRCVVLLVPVLGNILIFLQDLAEYKKLKADFKRWESIVISSQNLMGLLSGHDIDSSKMGPAAQEGQQYLIEACKEGDLARVSKLLKTGICLEFTHYGLSPLAAACSSGRLEIAKCLIAHAPQVLEKQEELVSAFCLSSFLGHIEIMHLLRPHITDINCENEFGETPLIHAASGKQAGVIAFLLEEGADREKKGTKAYKQSPFTYAIYANAGEDVLSLLATDEDCRNCGYMLPIPRGIFSPPLRVTNQIPLLVAAA